MTRAKRIARNVLRVAVALVLTVSGVTAWTHYGNGKEAPRIGLSLSRDWYDRAELNPAATGLAPAIHGISRLSPRLLAALGLPEPGGFLGRAFVRPRRP